MPVIRARPVGVLGDIGSGEPKRSGVSVIVCCHNSGGVLPKTLEYLSKQSVSPNVPWEVVLVDNCSTDGTAVLARRLWPSGAPAPMRIVREDRLGLAHARARGIAHARYEYLGFVDDDNWLDRRWVQTTFELFSNHDDIAAAGSVIEPEFETPRPDWFGAVSNLYATGPSPELVGDVTERHVPCGAGLCLRYAALIDAQQKGFRSLSIGRRGASLSAGEDSELIYCVRLAGWRVCIEPRLRLRHFLPCRRLHWDYARRLAYWSAHATPERDALVYACKPPRRGLLNRARRLRECWLWQLCGAASRLLREPSGIVKALLASSASDGDADVLRVEFLRGRFDGLMAARTWYATRSSEVRDVMARLSRSPDQHQLLERRPVPGGVARA